MTPMATVLTLVYVGAFVAVCAAHFSEFVITESVLALASENVALAQRETSKSVLVKGSDGQGL